MLGGCEEDEDESQDWSRPSRRVGGGGGRGSEVGRPGVLKQPTAAHGQHRDKGGGEEKCHGCKKIAEEETDEGDVDGEDLHQAGKRMTLPGRAEVALGTNIETIMVTIMVLLNSQCNIISSTFPVNHLYKV